MMSMTGFGRSSIEALGGFLSVEVSSVNRKYLEIQFSLPREFLSFEPVLRRKVQEKVSRGQVNVRVSLLRASGLTVSVPPQEALAALKKEWEARAAALSLSPKEVTLSFLANRLAEQKEEVFSVDEMTLSQLQLCLERALDSLVEMKRKEGEAMTLDIERRFANIEKELSRIEKEAPSATEKMRRKLSERMQEVCAAENLDERLFREVALFSEKVDVSEEIARLKSHLSQSVPLKKGGLSGRKLEFLLQEIGREVNTIGSKALDVEISRAVIEMKSELEKIREQVQNIE